MNPVSRRRFLTDLLFTGGALTLAAGLAWTHTHSAEAAGQKTPTPSPSKTPPKHLPMPGEMCPAPQPSSTPKSSPTPKS